MNNNNNNTLEYLGEIQMNSFFNTLEGQKIWEKEENSSLQIINSLFTNETIIILSYLDNVDIWIINKTTGNDVIFKNIDKIWRGSALKWFKKYNGALYNIQFVTENGDSDAILMVNPRYIEANDYWPRDRGRFLIRIIIKKKRENFENVEENRTREQNLTYELLQSDYKTPGEETQIYSYSFKVLTFFGVSLAIFSVFGFILFLKRCVTCPSQFRSQDECHKSPAVIRYSVIPDDLLYPVA